MMTATQIDRATRKELAEELGAGGEYSGDWRTASLDDLRERVRGLVSRYTDIGTVRAASLATPNAPLSSDS